MRLLRPLFIISLLVGFLSVCMPAQGRSFTPRFSQDLSGDILIASNSLMTCSTSGLNGSQCAGARNNTGLGAVADGALTNNHYNMVNVDIDGDPSTANSSSATLTVPSGSAVVWAGLYWAASAPVGMTAEEAKAVKLKGPGDTAYQDIVATSYDAAPSSSFGYDCFADVTEMVQDRGSGVWTAGGVAARTGVGTGNQAGWSLVVVYSNNAEPTRNLTVFDGQSVVANTDTIDIPITGFRTPPTGAVDTTVGMVTFEGDRGIVGDYAQLDSNTLSDSKHLSSNFFNSWIANKGQAVGGRNPSYTNQLGWDATTISVGNLLGNNATSTTLHAKTDGDGYQPLLFTFSTDLYAPHFNPIKSVEDLNGGEVRAGDVLEYTIDLTNDGGDNATNMVFSESAMPSGTGYVADSVTVDGVAPDSSLVDQPADGGSDPLTLRLGTGADATNGGTIAPGESHQIKFQVTVLDPLPSQGAQISNQALMNFVFESLGQPMQVKTNVSNIQVNLPDLSISKTATSAHIADGLPGQYTLHVSNVGLSDTSGTVTVTDTLPEQFANPAVGSADGWDCSITSGVLTCTRSDALAPAASYPDIIVDSPAMDIPGGETVTNTASVEDDLDADPSNNSSTVSTSQQGISNLAVSNSAGSSSVAPGQTVQFTADYSNTGPSTALNPTLTFVLANGVTTSQATISDYTVTSSNGSVTKADCALSSPGNTPTIVCNPAVLAKDASVQIVATLLPNVSTTLDTITTRAIIQAANDAGSPHQDDAAVDLLPSADLSLTKAATPTSANRGESVTYTLQVANAGPSSSGLVSIVDPVPAGITVQNASWAGSTGGSGSCTVLSNTVTCGNLPRIAPGQTLTATIHGQVAQTASGYQDNNAAVTSTTNDPNPDNNDATQRFTVLPSANLEIIKSGPLKLAPEQSGVYTLQAVNHGPSASTETVVQEKMPSGMSLTGKLPRSCSKRGQTITCQAGTMTSGASRKWTFRMKISANTKLGTHLHNQATVSSRTTELVPSNNNDQVTTAIVPASRPRLGIELFITPRFGAKPWQTVKLTVRITNRHYATVKRPKACVTVPLNLWGNPYRHICWYSGPLAGYHRRSFSVNLLARRPGIEMVRAGAEAQNAHWVGTRKSVSIRNSFTG